MKTFYELKEPEREQVVRRLMKEGGSNKSVAKALKTKPNTIAGYRWGKKIPSTHPPAFGGKKKEAKQTPMPPKKKPRAEPRKIRLAVSEATQCQARDEEGKQCGRVREEGSLYCELPKHQALEVKSKHTARRS